MSDKERIYNLLTDSDNPVSWCFPSNAEFLKLAEYLSDNGVTFYVHKTENSMCLYCNSSMSADAPDGSQVLVCFDCAGHEGKEMIVGDDECCPNYNGIV